MNLFKTKENKRTFLISAVAVMAAAVMAAAAAIGFSLSLEAGEKTLTLRIVYADKIYEYEGLITEKKTVAGFLNEYDGRLSLKLKTEDTGYGAYIVSLKGTDADAASGLSYVYELSGVDFASGISSQAIRDGQTLTISFRRIIFDENWNETENSLAPGGDNSSQTMDNPSFASGRLKTVLPLAIVSAALTLGFAAYVTVIAVKAKRTQKKEEGEDSDKG